MLAHPKNLVLRQEFQVVNQQIRKGNHRVKWALQIMCDNTEEFILRMISPFEPFDLR
jgi:hypothetical protein